MTLEAEVKQLKAEITRIASDTQYNGQTLLDGSFDLRGYTNNHKVKIGYYSDEVILKKYTIEELNVAYDKDGKIDKAATTFTLGSEFPAGVEISETTKNKITFKGPLDFEMTLEVEKPAAGSNSAAIAGKLQFDVPKFDAAYDFADTGTGWGNPKLNQADTAKNFADALKKALADGKSNIPADAAITGIGNANGNDTVVITNDSGFKLEIEITTKPTTNVPYAPGTNPPQENVAYAGGQENAAQSLIIDITGIGAMDIQTGANEGQQLAVRIPEISLNRMDMEDLKMTSIEECAEANKTIKNAILYVSDARSRLGAYQNRLEHTVNNLAVSNENMTASYSRIMDVDMAEEMTAYTTEQVISQAAVSMLAQANERPSQVLQLLQ